MRKLTARGTETLRVMLVAPALTIKYQARRAGALAAPALAPQPTHLRGSRGALPARPAHHHPAPNVVVQAVARPAGVAWRQRRPAPRLVVAASGKQTVWNGEGPGERLAGWRVNWADGCHTRR